MPVKFIDRMQTRIVDVGGISAEATEVEITATDGTIISADVPGLASGEDWVYAWIKDPVNRETIRVTGIVGDTLTIERGINSRFPARAWDQDAIIQFSLQKEAFDDIEATIEDAQATADAALALAGEGGGGGEPGGEIEAIVQIVDNLEALKLIELPDVVQIVKVLGFLTVEDQGGGVFRWEADQDKSTHDGRFIIDPEHTSAVGGASWFVPMTTGTGCWRRINGTVINAAALGVFPGPDNVFTRLQEAVNLLPNDATLFLQSGTYLMNQTLVLKSRMTIAGANKQGAVLKRMNGSGNHVLQMSNIFTVVVRDLVIDGNRDNNVGSPGHGIRTENVYDILIEDCYIHNTVSYGIGHQAGPALRYVINRCHIRFCGRDGIDFKNTTNNSRAVTISNCEVSDWGKDASNQAGIDLRGRINVQNVNCLPGTGNDVTCVRFRTDDALNGLGAQGSTLTGFNFSGGTGSVRYGIVSETHSIHVSNGRIQGASGWARGVLLADTSSRNKVSNVSVELCENGFEDRGSENIMVACTASGATMAAGFRLNACRQPMLIGCESESNLDGFRLLDINTTSATLVGCVARNNTNESYRGVSEAHHLVGCLGYGAAPTNLLNASGQKQAELGYLASTVNFLRILGGTLNNSPILRAVGANENIDIRIETKGVGRPVFGNYGAGVVAATGHVEIKTLDGVVRRLLCF